MRSYQRRDITKVAFDWEIRISDFAIEREIRNPSSGWISIKKFKYGFHGVGFIARLGNPEKGFEKVFS